MVPAKLSRRPARGVSVRSSRAAGWAFASAARAGLLAMAAAIVAGGQVAGPAPSARLGVIRCSATAATPLVRIEGTAELVGDVVLTCHNAEPSVGFEPKGFVDVDIGLSLNVAVANRSGFGLGPDVSDAVLVVNGKNCAVPGPGRTFGSCGPEGGGAQDPMPGRLDATLPHSLRWSGVALPIPGAAIGGEGGDGEPVADCSGRYGVPGGCHPTTTTVRLTNIRANAAELGAPGGQASGAVAVQASISIRAADATVLLEDGMVRVAEAASGMVASAALVDADRLCSHGETVAEVTIAEGFASAFKDAARPTFHPGNPGWDEGYYPFSQSSGAPAVASTATRVSIALSGLPSGVQVTVPAAVLCSSPEGLHSLALGFVAGASADGTGGAVIPWRAGTRTLADGRSSHAVAVYEVTRTETVVQEECRIPIRFAPADPTTKPTSGSSVTVSANLAPSGTAAPARSSTVLQRFVAPKRQVPTAVRLIGCGTTLFFPFVTNRTNFDTAIVISNTSADPLGTRHQSGRCTLRYHSAGAESQDGLSAQAAIELEAGDQLAFTLSSGNAERGIDPIADFQGYLVTQCDFQHAQGFAFVTEQVNGAAILAQGYLAEILSEPRLAASSADAR